MKPYNRPNGKRCAWTDDDERCSRKAVGRSDFCATHRSEARKSWAEKLREAAAEREARHAEAEAILFDLADTPAQPTRDGDPVLYLGLSARETLGRVARREGWRPRKRRPGVWRALPVLEAAAAVNVLRRYGVEPKVETA